MIIKKHAYRLFIHLFLIFFSLSLFGQNPDFEWANSTGGSGTDIGIATTTDTNGNTYVAGYFQNTADFDPGTGTNNITSNGGNDIFIQKFDPNGNSIWVITLGGNNNERVYDITTDDSNNVFVTGRFGGTVDFDPGPGIYNLTSNGQKDIYIMKLDPNGNLLWAHSIGGNNGDRGLSITADGTNVIITGRFEGLVDFNPGPGTKI